jgi:hypothetical protein
MSMDDIDIDKISRVLIQPTKGLSLRMHIKLLKEKDGRKENFHNIFSFNNNKYLKLDLQSFLTLEIIEGDWDKDKTIFIDQKNIYQIIKGFKKMIDSIYDNGIFAVNKRDEIVIYKDMVEKYTQKIFNIGGNQKMIIKPAIIYDDNEVSYEGVILYINRSEYYAELSIDAFESLYYALSKVDIFAYSQQLLNYYMSCVKDQKVELKEVTIAENYKKKKVHPLLMEDKEEVKSTLVKEPTAEEFFNIN